MGFAVALLLCNIIIMYRIASKIIKQHSDATIAIFLLALEQASFINFSRSISAVPENSHSQPVALLLHQRWK
jgi:hypothetical protein